MKQYINAEQLNELSDKGKEKFYKWAKEKGYIPQVQGMNMVTGEIVKEVDLPTSIFLPSIGQMIEYLLNLQEKEHKGQYYTKDDGVLSIMLAVSDIRPIKVLNWQGDLCDALWEAVKEHFEQ